MKRRGRKRAAFLAAAAAAVMGAGSAVWAGEMDGNVLGMVGEAEAEWENRRDGEKTVRGIERESGEREQETDRGSKETAPGMGQNSGGESEETVPGTGQQPEETVPETKRETEGTAPETDGGTEGTAPETDGGTEGTAPETDGGAEGIAPGPEREPEGTAPETDKESEGTAPETDGESEGTAPGPEGEPEGTAPESEGAASESDSGSEEDTFRLLETERESAAAGKTDIPKRGEGYGGRMDTVQVTLPISAASTFDFIMDPQQLITGTDAAAYGGKTFQEDATVFFRRFDGESDVDYSSLSDALTVTNMGTENVEVVMTANICLDFADGIVMTDDMEFTDDTDTSFYLALTDGNVTVPVTGEEGASISVILQGNREGEDVYSCGRFRLLGAVNGNGDWSRIPGAVPEVTVTWDIISADAGWLRETMETEKVPETEKDSVPGETKDVAESETEAETVMETGEEAKGRTMADDG